MKIVSLWKTDQYGQQIRLFGSLLSLILCPVQTAISDSISWYPFSKDAILVTGIVQSAEKNAYSESAETISPLFPSFFTKQEVFHEKSSFPFAQKRYPVRLCRLKPFSSSQMNCLHTTLQIYDFSDDHFSFVCAFCNGLKRPL